MDRCSCYQCNILERDDILSIRADGLEHCERYAVVTGEHHYVNIGGAVNWAVNWALDKSKS
jgi:hypothetical protein